MGRARGGPPLQDHCFVCLCHGVLFGRIFKLQVRPLVIFRDLLYRLAHLVVQYGLFVDIKLRVVIYEGYTGPELLLTHQQKIESNLMDHPVWGN